MTKATSSLTSPFGSKGIDGVLEPTKSSCLLNEGNCLPIASWLHTTFPSSPIPNVRTFLEGCRITFSNYRNGAASTPIYSKLALSLMFEFCQTYHPSLPISMFAFIVFMAFHWPSLSLSDPSSTAGSSVPSSPAPEFCPRLVVVRGYFVQLFGLLFNVFSGSGAP